MHETIDDSDETLSLSDLPLYGDQSVEESKGLTYISSPSNYFEFFTNELLPSAACFPSENIIFCGKIIPYKKPDVADTIPSKEVEIKQPTTSIKKKRGWSVFKWRFSTKRSSKTGNGKSTTHHQTSKKRYNKKKQRKGYSLPLHKMSVLTNSSSGKARWYLFLTGISRFSSRMELRDIKSRQSRRHSPPPSPSTGSSRLWDVIRLLSCVGNQNPSAMVVGSISCNRLE